MTDRKFTGDEVIKALRELQEMSEFTPPICHYEKDITEPPFCKPFEQFQNDVKVALALINRQKAEIERLNKCIKTEDEVREIMKSQMLPMVKEIGRIKAIKEFAKRLKAKEAIHFCKCGQPFVYTDLFNGEIDNIAKEMTETK
jgi:hypothetical protein